MLNTLADYSLAIAIACGFLVGGLVIYSGPNAARRIDRWRRVRRWKREQVALLASASPEVRTRLETEYARQQVELEERSKRATQFCDRYAADLIADGHDPESSYREAQAVYQEIGGAG